MIVSGNVSHQNVSRSCATLISNCFDCFMTKRHPSKECLLQPSTSLRTCLKHCGPQAGGCWVSEPFFSSVARRRLKASKSPSWRFCHTELASQKKSRRLGCQAKARCFAGLGGNRRHQVTPSVWVRGWVSRGHGTFKKSKAIHTISVKPWAHAMPREICRTAFQDWS